MSTEQQTDVIINDGLKEPAEDITTTTVTATKEVIQDDPKPKPKTTRLSFSERARIITDFQNGIIDKNYSVNVNPRKPGEYIVRKRKVPIQYELPTKQTINTDQNVKQPVKYEVINEQPAMNETLRNELDLLRTKYDKLSKKFAKLNSKQYSRSYSRKPKKVKEYDYEYEYVDDDDNNDNNKQNSNINSNVNNLPGKRYLNIADY